MIRLIDDVQDGRIDADVCIVGSGAAGLTLAEELGGSGLRVVLLESGIRGFDDRYQRLFESEVVGLQHGGIHSHRFRVFGGATTRWAGQALPLLDIDFEPREWVSYSGWPIDRSELEPYYARAARIMGINEFQLHGGWPSVLAGPVAFDRELLVPTFSQFSGQPNFATSLGARLADAPGVEIILGANVTELVTDTLGSEVHVARAVSLDGRTLDVAADFFVLCAGGIETARILLASDAQSDGGLGNGHDLVGRYFQDHPGITVGTVAPVDARRLGEAFRPRKQRGIKFQPLIGVAESLQRREHLLNACGAILFHTNQSESINAGKLIFRSLRHPELRSEARTAAKTVVREPIPLMRSAARYFVLRQPAQDPGAVPTLAVGCEQVPNPDSRVLLSDRRDATGMRRSVLDWRLTEAEMKAWRRSADLIATELERLELARVDLDQLRIPDDPEQLSGYVVDTGHHMGTTRMSDSAQTGVVDPNCQVFGVDNLYIGSASVFPTSGTSNPTFTIIALAARISDTIRRRAANQVALA